MRLLSAKISFRLAAALAVGLTVPARGAAQQPLDHDVYERWRTIEDEHLSADGAWVLYSLAQAHGDGDAELQVLNPASGEAYQFARGVDGEFSDDSRFAIFLIEPRVATVDSLEAEDAPDDEMPSDSLGILDLASGQVVRVARVASFQLPERAAGWVAYLLDEDGASTAEEDEGQPEPEVEDEEERKKEEGATLVLRNLDTAAEHRYADVTDYAFSEDGELLAFTASNAAGDADGVYTVDVADGVATAILTGEGVYESLVLDESGEQLAFLTNRDDWAADEPAFALYHWREGWERAEPVARAGMSGIPTAWVVSEHGEVDFSDDGTRLFFGTAPRPLPELDEDDLPPEDERVVVDVWNWKDPYLQPMQLLDAEDERERSYRAVAHLDDGGRLVQLATAEMPEVEVGSDGDADVAIGVSVLPYRQLISWESPGYRDVYLVDVSTGERELILERTQARAELSPDATFAVWFDNREQVWFARDVESGRVVSLTDRIPYAFYEELHDRPEPADSYGLAGWTEGDDAVLVYDAHDIWAVDPTGADAPRNITEGVGRRDQLRFRVIELDPEAEAIDPSEPLLLSAFHLYTKSEGFYRDRVDGDAPPEALVFSDHAYSRPTQADDADVVLFTRESFVEFPDLWVSGLDFADARKLSDANPQQAEYRWGTAELVEWRSVEGEPLQGILYKPDGFDPSMKYPMMVYFYERRSDRLNDYYVPVPGSSSINISFYVSRGYLVFVPDIPYETGFPGESAMQAVIPGVLSLIDEGFVDADAIGVQGHSWGGYQIAYMITRTDIFAAAEAGAPVANMTSAYGGIRWGSGRSRTMQYEYGQSRIAKTLWDGTLRYIENSPLFWVPKIETPLLMMHNDADTAVPWEQGIEMFLAMRRLGKPVWMLNYNGAPHGLSDDPDRRDFAIRMQQFFDHYLKGAPAPVWLARGVPAVMKGRTLGLDLVEEDGAVASDDPQNE